MKIILLALFLFVSLKTFAQNQKVEKKIEACENTSEIKANDDLRAYAAKENKCSIKDVKFLNHSQTKNVGIYILCVDGKIMKYRRLKDKYSKIE